MTDYLKAASERYSQRGNMISPISEIDAKIISEVLDIFSKLDMKVMVDILTSYKYESDVDVYDTILEYSKHFDKEKILSQQRPIRFLMIGGRRIDIYNIVGYDSINTEDKDGNILYGVLLNPTPESAKMVPFYSNEFMGFSKEEERDEVLKKLDYLMELTRGRFFTDIES